MAKKIEMYRGDYREMVAKLPIASYTEGGTMYFGAKLKSLVSSADATDANAVVLVTATSPTLVDEEYAHYTLVFEHATTSTKTPGRYIGETQYVDSSGRPTTFSPQVEFILLSDVVQTVS